MQLRKKTSAFVHIPHTHSFTHALTLLHHTPVAMMDGREEENAMHKDITSLLSIAQKQSSTVSR
jgi:hypothetical protein